MRSFFSRRSFRRLSSLTVLVGLVLTTVALASAQNQPSENPVQKSRELARKGMQAYQKKDFTAYLENVREAAKLRPNFPPVLYHLARASFLTGNQSESLRLLTQLSHMGNYIDLNQDEDLKPLQAKTEFTQAVQTFEALKKPVAGGQVAFELAEKGLITEGITYLPSEKAFLVSSVRKRKVFKISQDGKVSDFLTSGQDGLWGVFGMKVDPKRNRLWLCTSVVREIEGFKAEEDGQAGVFQYDLKTHTLVKKYILPNSEQGHVFGDLELHPKGDVYITDSKSGGLYRISAATDTLERFLDTSPFVSPQGMALTPDGKRMFVADYSVGIGILDLATKTFSLVPATPEMLLLGIDGLYLHQNSLIGMQNGILPKRVIRLDLDTKLSRIEKLSVIERGTQHLEDPTLGVIVNHSIYFIANSQWESFDKDGTMFPPDKLNQHIILKASLK
ncbi:MAG TPA: hypothetical protein PLU80_12185 [Acidobacteriota bacterium]|nr:hypothetical protein [Acidobacteriota bacterium]HNB71193.1 hypothetical protein [Acidobacteriota bacterium]HNC44919.1 hypothetical protein [Acidobacteriota bacterium]HNG93060.1 hypothetical protein [Acidobacteriota bacterium]HNH81163.1 hypothetical protein [Acidobacteriota bacterium]